METFEITFWNGIEIILNSFMEIFQSEQWFKEAKTDANPFYRQYTL